MSQRHGGGMAVPDGFRMPVRGSHMELVSLLSVLAGECGRRMARRDAEEFELQVAIFGEIERARSRRPGAVGAHDGFTFSMAVATAWTCGSVTWWMRQTRSVQRPSGLTSFRNRMQNGAQPATRLPQLRTDLVGHPGLAMLEAAIVQSARKSSGSCGSRPEACRDANPRSLAVALFVQSLNEVIDVGRCGSSRPATTSRMS